MWTTLIVLGLLIFTLAVMIEANHKLFQTNKKLLADYSTLRMKYSDTCQRSAHIWDMYCELAGQEPVTDQYDINQLEDMYKLVDPRE